MTHIEADIEAEAFIITKVEKQKKNRHRYNIFINEAYAFSVHEDILIKHRLIKGESIQVDQTKQIIEDEERHKSYSKAVELIGRRPHSIQEIERKLKEKGYEEDTISFTIDTLKQQNYMNDKEFAKILTENRISGQRKGRNYIRQELQQKGVDQEFIRDALDDINVEEEWNSALKLGEKKWSVTSGTKQDRRRKTVSFLLRRGFVGSLVTKVMKHIDAAGEDEELDIHIEESFDD
ncbi:regulatory protein RecX [Paenibacillus eucommiae]|uniref:Regulatory protein RecX n=1 Tax=Paenibacillus eucommiae TaxID=1355755 RepID=A0ABS4IUK9_9BACL|nr:RecX family transcriptional regulator [Paenibacillus eucommiae]MBP1991262.1 regulatory protein [Paenibacillus eucommiae]